MKVDGPAGLRLQDVARAAGVSHPTILHHFGSREGLVRALNQRSVEALRNSVLARLEWRSPAATTSNTPSPPIATGWRKGCCG